MFLSSQVSSSFTAGSGARMTPEAVGTDMYNNLKTYLGGEDGQPFRLWKPHAESGALVASRSSMNRTDLSLSSRQTSPSSTQRRAASDDQDQQHTASQTEAHEPKRQYWFFFIGTPEITLSNAGQFLDPPNMTKTGDCGAALSLIDTTNQGYFHDDDISLLQEQIDYTLHHQWYMWKLYYFRSQGNLSFKWSSHAPSL